MATFFYIILFFILIAFWKHLLLGLLGALFFGLLGSIFGVVGTIVGALFGFASGVVGTIEQNKEKQENNERRKAADASYGSESETERSHATNSSSRASSSNSNEQAIQCPGCSKTVLVRLPLEWSAGQCPTCSIIFELLTDALGKVHVGRVQRDQKSEEREQSYRKNREEPKTPRSKSTADYYAILGVSSSATPDEVRAAYRKKIRQYHPDRVAGLGEKLQEVATEESKTINKAYSTLKAAGRAS